MQSLFLIISLWFSNQIIETNDGFIEKHKTHVSFSKGKMIVSYQILIQINNPDGNHFAEVQIVHSESNKLKNLNATIYNSLGKSIKTLKSKDIRDKNYFSDYNFYSDYRIKEFDLIHNEFPYRLEYSYEIEYDQFIYYKWYPNYKNFFSKEASLTIEHPKEFEVQIVSIGLDSIEVNTTESETIKRSWIVKNSQSIEQEELGPSWQELSSSVFIIPKIFMYGNEGHATSWQEYGDWVTSLSWGYNDLSEEYISKLRSKVAGITDKKEITKILFNDLQDEMRYVNISMDIGGMKPFPASFVEQNKYGDCKALTYYMKSALELFDIESFPVDVYWSENPTSIVENAYTQQFNHVFLCVPIEGDTIWLENTSQTQPFNYIDTNKQGEKGLLINEGSSQLITLPKASLEAQKSITKINFKLKDNDALEGELIATYRGKNYEILSYINKNWQKSEIDIWMNKNVYPTPSELYDWNLNLPDRNEPLIEMTATLDLSNLMKKYGSNLVLFIPPSDLPTLKLPNERKYDLCFKAHKNVIDTLIYEMDISQFKSIILPKSQDLNTDIGVYRIDFEQSYNLIKCIRSLQIQSDQFTKGDSYSEFYIFIEKIKAIEKDSYIQLKL